MTRALRTIAALLLLAAPARAAQLVACESQTEFRIESSSVPGLIVTIEGPAGTARGWVDDKGDLNFGAQAWDTLIHNHASMYSVHDAMGNASEWGTISVEPC